MVRNVGGKPRPFGDDRPRKGGVTAAAIVLGIGLASGGAVTTSVGGGGASSASRVRAQDTASVVLRWERRGLRVTSRLSVDDDNCAEHSYGQVTQFFLEHPCMGLSRAFFEVRDARRNVVLVAISSVEMPDVDDARAFHELVDTDGTGNITELSRERGRYRHVRFSGEHYESRRDGTVVVNAQAQPVGRTAVAAELAEIVADAVG